MPWDDLVCVKTMNDVRTSRDVRTRPLKTSLQVFRTRELVYPVNERPITIALERERRRFAKQTEALSRTKNKVEHVRAKLYGVREKNRRLVQLRYQLQKERWASVFSSSAQKPEPQNVLKGRVREVRIRRG